MVQPRGSIIRPMPDEGAQTVEVRRPIRVLPPLLVNQIAAGEVVDRPASVVKELVENAVDAGSTRITVELEQGGVELIRVTDDGGGIPPEELPLAVAPHATSKVAAPEDLDRIATMGFRGEALASIASVSRLSIRSRTRDDAAASVLEAEGDVVRPVRPASGPRGTQVSVRNLFFNTPARRKFLRTPGTEQGHCVDTCSQLALANPNVGFTVACDGRTVLDVPPGQGPRERVLAVLGSELAPELLEVSSDGMTDRRGVALWGLAGRPSIARATAKGQHVLLNGRPIRDKTVQHALREAYRGLIEPTRSPTAVLMLEMDPASVDVNVHPAKAEVRWRDQSMVHTLVLRAVREALRSADLTPNVGERGGGAGGPIFGPGNPDAWSPRVGADEHASPSAPVSVSPAAFVEFFKRYEPGRTQEPLNYGELKTALAETGPLPLAEVPETIVPPAMESSRVSVPLHAPVPAPSVLQVHNSFVVTQDEHGLVIVDQHALHERVMFEALLRRIEQGPLESQPLLVPVVVPATGTQQQKLDDLAPLLSRLGIAVRAMSSAGVGVEAFPTFLFERGVDPGEFVRDLLERAEGEGFTPGGEETLAEVLDMMACKAAVKAGDRMSDGELRDLLKLREAVERSSNCPHGRPTSIRLSIRELEKRFGRS
jgi:DNA mismatch repair protein MutL